MSGFFDRLEERARESGSRLCVGLDPRAGDAAGAKRRALGLIEEAAPSAAAFKANSAFYETHGPSGLEALIEVVAAVPEEIPVIVDVKRGDIAATAEAYAAACFEVIGAGAVTLSPYLGRDGIDPFLAHKDRGVFVLCRTSNPSSAEFQGLDVGGETLAERVAGVATGWAGADRLGLVVGATAPQALASVRAAAPDHWILAPGLGAQGADPGLLGAGLRDDGAGLLVNVSRALAAAADPATAAADLRGMLAGLVPVRAAGTASSLASGLYALGCLRFGEFTLRSGVTSPVYVDLRRLTGSPPMLRRVGRAYAGVIAELAFDRLGAVPYGALPIATAVSLAIGAPLVWPRPREKGHGTGARVEGDWRPGERVVLVDDVVTSGTSAVAAASLLRDAGLIVEDLAVLLDRSDGAPEALAAAGIDLHAVTTLSDVVDELAVSGEIDGDRHRMVTSYLAGR